MGVTHSGSCPTLGHLVRSVLACSVDRALLFSDLPETTQCWHPLLTFPDWPLMVFYTRLIPLLDCEPPPPPSLRPEVGVTLAKPRITQNKGLFVHNRLPGKGRCWTDQNWGDSRGGGALGIRLTGNKS